MVMYLNLSINSDSTDHSNYTFHSNVGINVLIFGARFCN